MTLFVKPGWRIPNEWYGNENNSIDVFVFVRVPAQTLSAAPAIPMVKQVWDKQKVGFANNMKRPGLHTG